MKNLKINNIYFYSLFLAFLLPVITAYAATASIRKDTTTTGKIIVNVKFKDAKPNDTLTLEIVNTLYRKKPLYITERVGNLGWFHFEIPVGQKCGYWTLYKRKSFTYVGKGKLAVLLSERFWENGDSITVHLANQEKMAGIYSDSQYSGRGARKYTVKDKIDSITKTQIFDNKATFAIDTPFNLYNPKSEEIMFQLNLLNNFKKDLTPLSYSVLESSIKYQNSKAMHSSIFLYYNEHIRNRSEDVKKKFYQNFKRIFFSIDESQSSDELINSQAYLRFLYYRSKSDSYLINDGKSELHSLYYSIKKGTKGRLRDKLILMFFLDSRRSKQVNTLYRDASLFVTDKISLDILNDLIENAPGSKMDFSLPDVTGNIVNAKDFRGKVALIDFWFDGCGYCAHHYKNVLSKIEEYFADKQDVVFISINGDRDIKYLKKGIKENKYTSARAVNLYTAGKGFDHDLILKYSIKAFPFVILLDKEGNIKYLNAENLYSYDTLLAAIKSLQ